MVNIYERIFDDYDADTGVILADMDEAIDRLIEKDWDSEMFDLFVNTVREVIDGGAGSFPETYFDITQPTSLSLDRVKHELDQKPYRPEASNDEERDGFQYEVDGDGVVHVTWYYTSINRGITGIGNVQTTTSEESIQFRINPSRSLLVVESTYPISVQKMKRVIREETPNMSMDVAGVDPKDEDISFKDRIDSFRNTFETLDEDEIPGGEI